MDATQMISDSVLESEDEENEEEQVDKRGRPLAKLCILKNQHIPETELPLFLGDNVLGRDSNICTLPLQAPSISKQHATICISAYRRKGRPSDMDVEALVWDLGSMNGTRKGRLKLTPNVRYALSEQDSLVVADIPCQYVSCAVDRASSQGDFRTPVSKDSGVKAKLSDNSGQKSGDTSADRNKCVNGDPNTRVSLADLEDTKKTPARPSFLSFEQTPVQPEGSLVPESDSDSDGESEAVGERRHKTLVSNSDSSSTFLSPSNKTVPESEDESPITPSSSTKNRPYRSVSFSKEETDIDMGRQQLKEKKALAFVDDSEEEEGKEEERASQAGSECEKSGQHVPVKQNKNVSFTAQDDLAVLTPTDVNPAFNMDSDTDVEGEEVGEPGEPSVGPVTSSPDRPCNQPPEAAHLHMDSDTDVDESNDASDNGHKSGPSLVDDKPPHVIPVVQPEGITMDSDTDVDEDDAVSETATSAQPVSNPADSASSTQLKDFHLDSDTDLDEEEENESGTNTTGTKLGETPNKTDIKPSEPKSAPSASQFSHLESGTDYEAPSVSAPAVSEPTTDRAAELDILSDSDTDVEDDPPPVIPVGIKTLPVSSDSRSGAPQLDSGADTDMNEPTAPPTGEGVNPAELEVGSDTDVEDQVVDFAEAGEGRTPSLCRENTPRMLATLVQNCSTPVQLPGQVEDMETQAFLSPSSGPHGCAAASSGRPKTFPSLSDSNEEEDFIVAETQSFILHSRNIQGEPEMDHATEPTQAFGLDSSGNDKEEQSPRGGSFKLGLSDSSHLQGDTQALAMESTQAFAFVGGGVTLEETQAFATTSNADRASLEDEEATQKYGEDEEDAECSDSSEKEGQVDLALEATQAYISEPCHDSEDETNENERKGTSSPETQPLDVPTSSTLAMAETQPMSAYEEERISDDEKPVSLSKEFKSRSQHETKEREQHGKEAPPQEGHAAKSLSLAETQPLCLSDNEESEEESIVSSRKRKAKPLHLEDEQTQTLTNSQLSVAETQPMDTAGDEESDEEDSIPGPRKRKAKRLQIQEDESQTLINSGLSAAETQPIATGIDDESEEEDSFPGPYIRKAKPLPIQEEESQSLPNSQASTMGTQPIEENVGLQRGRKPEAESSGITVRAKREETSRLRGEEEQKECSEPPKRQTRGKTKALPTTKGRRGNSKLNENESEEEEEEEEQAKKIRGKKSMRLQKKEEEERLEKERNKEKLDRERKEKEKQERLEAETAERLEQAREDKERKEQEEKEKVKRAQEEQLERERKEREEKEESEREKAKRAEEEELQRKEKERAEKTQLEIAKREQEEQARQEREANERKEKERLEKEKQEKQSQQGKKEEENKEEMPARSRRAARRTTAATSTTQDDDDVPARRTRSRSNSSNSVSSERSAASVNTTESRGRGRGRGRGAKRTSGPPPAATGRSSNRRRTVAAGTAQQEQNDIPPQGVLSRSKSTNSLNSEIPNCSLNRGRGGRQRGRGRKQEVESVPPVSSQSEQSPAPKPAARGRKGRKAEESSIETANKDSQESQQASTTRGRQRANANSSKTAAADEEGPSNEDVDSGEESLLLKRNVRGRGRKAAKSKPVEAPVAAADRKGDEAERRGRKRELEGNTEVDSSSSSKISKGNEKSQVKESAAAEEKGETKRETNAEAPVQTKRRGGPSSIQIKNITRDSLSEVEEKMEDGTGESRDRGQPSEVQKNKKEEQEESESSADQDAHVETSEPKTPASNVSRKRQASADSSPIAKTPRSSSASPTAVVRVRASRRIYKVLFTGVVDEAGERVLESLGGSMAKGVADMNCLVTDKVRRTVKFLCAVAKGVPIVTTHWLEKSGKAGSFLPPNLFVVKDLEQEKKFSFCLEESLRTASSQPLLQGYEIHVTKSVKPEPVYMKDIISSSGATFLPKMPSTQKPHTVVISCEEDLSLCGPALSASLPVVSAEFILTGILQQKLDLQTYALSAPAGNLQPAGGRGRARKKT